jgi:hypothetical protein
MMISTLTASIAMHNYGTWWQPVRRWLHNAIHGQPAAVQEAVAAPACIRVRHRAAFAGRAAANVRPTALTPFMSSRPEATARRRAFVHCDPSDPRRAVIGGSFAEVCAALERLDAQSH